MNRDGDWKQQERDLVKRFFDEMTVPSSGPPTSAALIHQTFSEWSKAQGHWRQLMPPQFGAYTADLGIEKSHACGYTWYPLALKAAAPAASVPAARGKQRKLSPSDIEKISELLEERETCVELRNDAMRHPDRVGITFGHGSKVKWDLAGETARAISAQVAERETARIAEIEEALRPVVDFSKPDNPGEETSKAPAANGAHVAEHGEAVF